MSHKEFYRNFDRTQELFEQLYERIANLNEVALAGPKLVIAFEQLDKYIEHYKQVPASSNDFKCYAKLAGQLTQVNFDLLVLATRQDSEIGQDCISSILFNLIVVLSSIIKFFGIPFSRVIEENASLEGVK